jgi:ribonuclease HI
MPNARQKARLLERLAERADVTDAERAVLKEAAEHFSSQPVREEKPAAAHGTVAADAILWSDGAARGNPGPAGIGAVLKTRDGELLAECSDYLGHTTNNVAEYRALLAGLERACELGVKHLEVRADSELMIKQLRGQYRVKNPGLKPLFEQAKELIARFERVELKHVRREHNAEADRLANLGIDSR